MAELSDWLPPLVCLEDHGSEWARYFNEVKARYARSLGERPWPSFEGRRVTCKRHPVLDGVEATFWHIVSTGDGGEDARETDLRRCERIEWPRALLEAVGTDRVVVWRTRRGADDRVLIALVDFSYVVVLGDRRAYLILITAYPVDREHQRARLRREAEEKAPKR